MSSAGCGEGLILAGRAKFEPHGLVHLPARLWLGLEGIVSKRIGSGYVSGRTRAWLKTKNPNSSGGDWRARMIRSRAKRPQTALARSIWGLRNRALFLAMLSVAGEFLTNRSCGLREQR
jgi:hypothetical protein